MSAGSAVGVVRRTIVVAAALAAICLAALFAADTVAADSGAPRAMSPVGDPIAWGECNPHGEDLQCATIRVPLDWDRPNGRTIRLALIRHLASKPEQRIGTLFINPGGPGDTGVGLCKGDPEGIDAFGDGRFDVVSWDPRGTNASTRVAASRASAARRVLGRRSIPTTKRAAGALRAQGRRLARGAAARSAAGFCPTSRPPTPPATSTTCAP